MSVVDEIVRKDLIKESANVAAAAEAKQKPSLFVKRAPQAMKKKNSDMKRKSPLMRHKNRPLAK